MERPDPNIMPRFDLFPRLTRAGAFLGRQVLHEPVDAVSDHYRPPEASVPLDDPHAALLDEYLARSNALTVPDIAGRDIGVQHRPDVL